MMEADNNSPVPHSVPRASYETAEDFPSAVDTEAFRLVAEMNLRGLRVLREALADGRSPGLAAVDGLRSDWLALDDAGLARVAEAPFLLFELSIDAALIAHRSQRLAVSDDPHRVVSWCARPAGRAFARLLCHFCWQTCRTAPTAASLLLGISPAGCAAFRTLTLPNLDALTEIAGHWLALRWGDEPRHWRRRLQAAGRTDPEALWQDTLHGLQRLAAVARTPSASVRTGSRRSR
jgi:hypothetical protein